VVEEAPVDEGGVADRRQRVVALVRGPGAVELGARSVDDFERPPQPRDPAGQRIDLAAEEGDAAFKLAVLEVPGADLEVVAARDAVVEHRVAARKQREEVLCRLDEEARLAGVGMAHDVHELHDLDPPPAPRGAVGHAAVHDQRGAVVAVETEEDPAAEGVVGVLPAPHFGLELAPEGEAPQLEHPGLVVVAVGPGDERSGLEFDASLGHRSSSSTAGPPGAARTPPSYRSAGRAAVYWAQ
jgi:hypothetical protein